MKKEFLEMPETMCIMAVDMKAYDEGTIVPLEQRIEALEKTSPTSTPWDSTLKAEGNIPVWSDNGCHVRPVYWSAPGWRTNPKPGSRNMWYVDRSEEGVHLTPALSLLGDNRDLYFDIACGKFYIRCIGGDEHSKVEINTADEVLGTVVEGVQAREESFSYRYAAGSGGSEGVVKNNILHLTVTGYDRVEIRDIRVDAYSDTQGAKTELREELQGAVVSLQGKIDDISSNIPSNYLTDSNIKEIPITGDVVQDPSHTDKGLFLRLEDSLKTKVENSDKQVSEMRPILDKVKSRQIQSEADDAKVKISLVETHGNFWNVVSETSFNYPTSIVRKSDIPDITHKYIKGSDTISTNLLSDNITSFSVNLDTLDKRYLPAEHDFVPSITDSVSPFSKITAGPCEDSGLVDLRYPTLSDDVANMFSSSGEAYPDLGYPGNGIYLRIKDSLRNQIDASTSDITEVKQELETIKDLIASGGISQKKPLIPHLSRNASTHLSLEDDSTAVLQVLLNGNDYAGSIYFKDPEDSLIKGQHYLVTLSFKVEFNKGMDENTVKDHICNTSFINEVETEAGYVPGSIEGNSIYNVYGSSIPLHHDPKLVKVQTIASPNFGYICTSLIALNVRNNYSFNNDNSEQVYITFSEMKAEYALLN